MAWILFAAYSQMEEIDFEELFNIKAADLMARKILNQLRLLLMDNVDSGLDLQLYNPLLKPSRNKRYFRSPTLGSFETRKTWKAG